METLQRLKPIVCPACKGENPPDAVFCGNPECRKALGEFRYVIEEVAAKTSRIERLADTVTSFTGRPHFVTAHLAWFAAWVLLNSGLIVAVQAFDAYPFSLLGIILSVEAILITSFLLISQNRQNVHAEKRAELEYEVNVRSYRKIRDLQDALEAIANRIERLEKREK
jgi:uncharacterized membrane protein